MLSYRERRLAEERLELEKPVLFLKKRFKKRDLSPKTSGSTSSINAQVDYMIWHLRRISDFLGRHGSSNSILKGT